MHSLVQTTCTPYTYVLSTLHLFCGICYGCVTRMQSLVVCDNYLMYPFLLIQYTAGPWNSEKDSLGKCDSDLLCNLKFVLTSTVGTLIYGIVAVWILNALTIQIEN